MSYIENLRMEPVENGNKVSYTERSKSEYSGMHDSMDYNNKEFVFGEKDGKKAFAKYVELYKELKKK